LRMLCIMVRADSPQRELERDSSRGCAFEVQNMSTTTRRPMSKSPTESMTRIMQEKPAKAMAEIKAKRRTNRGAPRRARKGGWLADDPRVVPPRPRACGGSGTGFGVQEPVHL
jgi:hypothetical protein